MKGRRQRSVKLVFNEKQKLLLKHLFLFLYNQNVYVTVIADNSDAVYNAYQIWAISSFFPNRLHCPAIVEKLLGIVYNQTILALKHINL